LKAFRFNFFHGRPGDAQSFPTLGGHSSTVYDDSNDLLALYATDDPDRLTVFVRDNFGFLFQVFNLTAKSRLRRSLSGVNADYKYLVRRKHQPGVRMYPSSDMHQLKRLPTSSHISAQFLPVCCYLEQFSCSTTSHQIG
jgi:hypothetical protein